MSHFGIMDMVGNVWEWVHDFYAEDYYKTEGDWNNPTGPVFGYDNVIKGGSFSQIPSFLRCSCRQKFYPTEAIYNIGFRCVIILN